MIKVVNKISQEKKSLTCLLIGEQKFNFTDKEWVELLNQLYLHRPDLIEDCIAVDSYKSRVLELEAELDEALEELDRKENY